MAARVLPITPKAVSARVKDRIPVAVIEGFNEFILEKFCNGRAHFKLEEIVNHLVKKGLDRHDLFDKHWLDVEDVYRKAGWKVEFDSPGYNESYPATFTFSV